MATKKSDTESDAKPDVTPDVIDAEIVEEAVSEPAPSSPESVKIIEEIPAAKAKSGKAGWITAGLLAAFVAGIFAAPYGEDGLRSMGILAPSPGAGDTRPDQQIEATLASLERQLSDMGVSVSRFQENLAQHSAQLGEAVAARKQISDDVALIAAQPGRISADAGASSQTIQQLEARLAEITAEVARLAVLSGSDDPDITGLTGSIALARAETNQLKAKLALLETAVQQMQAGALDVSPRGRLLLALGRLKDSAFAGAPLGGELDAIRLDIAELPALDQQLIGADVAILVANRQGIETYENLTREFDGVANAAKKAQEKADGSLLASLFTVRRTDENATGIDAILLTVEKRLAVRDLDGALTALNGLSGDGAAAMADWRQQALAHRDVLVAFDRLLRQVSASATGGSR